MTGLKIAREWFRDNPRCVVSFHFRWTELTQASRDRLAAPRKVRTIGAHAIFDCPTSGRSEVALGGCDATVTADGELQLFTGTRHFVSYRSAPESGASILARVLAAGRAD